MAAGRAGAPPKPKEQHLEDGTFRADRHGDLPAEWTGGERLTKMPDCPATIANTKDGKETWDEIAECILALGVVREADALALEAMTLALLTIREAQTIINEEGILGVDRFGQQKPHPAITVRDKAAGEFRAWASRFGMTPSDRMAIGLNAIRGQQMGEALAKAIGATPRQSGTDDIIIDDD